MPNGIKALLSFSPFIKGMKVENLAFRPASAGAKKTGAAAGGNFARELAQNAQDVAMPLKITAPITPLIAQIEEVDINERRQRAKYINKGHEILNQLQRLQEKLILGEVPKADLIQMVKLTKESLGGLKDDKLMNIMDDIEMRARIELAKLGIYTLD